MDGWKTFSFPFGFRPIFRCELLVSGRVNGAGYTPQSLKGWNLKPWWELQVRNRSGEACETSGVYGFEISPPKKQHLSLAWVSVIMVYHMTNILMMCHPNSFMPEKKKAKTKNTGRDQTFQKFRLPGVELREKSQHVCPSISNRGQNNCQRQNLPLQRLRVASFFESPSESYSETLKMIHTGTSTNYFLLRMWSNVCSFACFPAKDRSVFLLSLKKSPSMCGWVRDIWHWMVSMISLCAAGPSRMLSIGFGSSRVPFLDFVRDLAGLPPSWRVYHSW